jgi:formamidopyrimidine-DNA glycosylase
MPELPELEVIREVLQHRVTGQILQAVKIIPPGGAIVVRDLTNLGFAAALAGATFKQITRRGKFLIFSFQSAGPPLYLALNPKLSGRLQLAPSAAEKLRAKTDVVFSLANGVQLRYFDQKQMGQLYLVHDLAQVPDYATLGPEALQISLAEFRERLKPLRGEIKGILTRGEVVAGIGNAYADEILWQARLHPYRKRNQLSPEQIEGLYTAMRATLLDAIEKVRVEMGEAIEREPRNFMAVHMKTGQPCPRCGTPISMVGANQRITNFCRNCQPGGLVKGMLPPPAPPF